MYIVNGVEFSTQSDLKGAIQEILHEYEPGQPLDAEDTDFMYDVLCMHKDASEKIGVGVASIGVRLDPDYKRNKQFVVYRKDGTFTDFSYAKCLRSPTHRARFIQACRQIIAPGIIAYGKQYFKSYPNPICPFTGEVLTPKTAHIDHAYPQTFRNLLEKFLNSTHLDIDQVVLISGGDNSSTVYIQDKTIEQAWLDYHWKFAKLRVISATANLAHGDRQPLKPMPPVSDWVFEAMHKEMEAKGFVKIK